MPGPLTDLAETPEKRTGGPNLAAGEAIVRRVAQALHDRMADLDLLADAEEWVVIFDNRYRKENWQRVLEYLAKQVLAEIERAQQGEDTKPVGPPGAPE